MKEIQASLDDNFPHPTFEHLLCTLAVTNAVTRAVRIIKKMSFSCVRSSKLGGTALVRLSKLQVVLFCGWLESTLRLGDLPATVARIQLLVSRQDGSPTKYETEVMNEDCRMLPFSALSLAHSRLCVGDDNSSNQSHSFLWKTLTASLLLLI